HTIATKATRLPNKVAAIPYPEARSRMINSPPPAIGDRDKIILFVGRVHPEKGVHLLIDAFASDARAAFVNWKLMIIGLTETKLGGGGEVYLASIRRAAGKADGRISFAGPIFDWEKLTDAYRSARLFGYPSLSVRDEWFVLASFDAMAD